LAGAVTVANICLFHLHAVRLSCHKDVLTLALEGGSAVHDHDVQIMQCEITKLLSYRSVRCTYDGCPTQDCWLSFDRECGLLQIGTPVGAVRFLMDAQLNVEFARALTEVR
jgi:hypothetical protein